LLDANLKSFIFLALISFFDFKFFSR